MAGGDRCRGSEARQLVMFLSEALAYSIVSSVADCTHFTSLFYCEWGIAYMIDYSSSSKAANSQESRLLMESRYD